MTPNRFGSDRPGTHPRGRPPAVFPGVVVFVCLVWLVLACLGTGDQGPAGDVVRQNLELSIDAGALFYTEVDIPTPTPIIGMMPDPGTMPDPERSHR